MIILIILHKKEKKMHISFSEYAKKKKASQNGELS